MKNNDTVYTVLEVLILKQISVTRNHLIIDKIASILILSYNTKIGTYCILIFKT